MELYDALHNRRTIHAYARDPLPEGALERALGAAIMAPNHRLTWPWRFTRVGRTTREPIAELAIRLKSKPDQPCTAELVAKVRAKILNPAELVVASIVTDPNPAIEREDYAATACAIQNLQLALTAEGVGSKWSSGAVIRHPETYAILDIDPAVEQIVGFIWVGIAAQPATAPRRPPLEQFVRARP